MKLQTIGEMAFGVLIGWLVVSGHPIVAGLLVLALSVVALGFWVDR